MLPVAPDYRRAIRPFAGVHLGHRLQRFQIHDAGLVFTPIAGDAEAEFRREGDAVNAGRIGDFADGLVVFKSMTTTSVACET